MSKAHFVRRGAVLVALLLAGLSPSVSHAQLPTFPHASLTILTTQGPVPLSVEVATTPAQLEQGLMFRQRLAPDSGMIFVFPSPRVVDFWMKNTLIPLDMLFVGADDRIDRIKKRAVPLSMDPISSETPVRAVIEINGGATGQLGVKRGDRVVFSGLDRAG